MQMFTPVGASSTSDTPLPPADPAAPLPPLEPVSALPPPEAPPAPTIANPGMFDEADHEAKGVLMLDCFDGCRFELQKALSQQFVLSHLVWLGSTQLPGGSMYQFGTQLHERHGDTGKETIMLGRASKDGSLEARLIHLPYPGVTASVVGNLVEEEGRSMGRAELKWKGSDFSAHATVANGLTLTTSYFQAVLPKVALGGEAIVHTGRKICAVSAKARYDDNTNKFTTQLSSIQGGMCSMSYMRQVNEHVALACDFEAVAANLESTMSAGWKYSLRPCTIQALLNSKGQIHATVTENLSPGFSVLFSAMLDHPNAAHKFGFGLQLMA